MNLIIGSIIIVVCVLGGYILHNGNLLILYQPTEYLIIGGAGIGSFIIGNQFHIIKKTVGSFKYLFKKGHPFSKTDYLQLLLFQYEIFRFMKTKGMLEIESHIENPEGSSLFQKYPNILHNHHAVEFICDYIRVMTMGVDNKYVLEDMMNAELESHHHDKQAIAGGIIHLGDAFPALGIVAAVLGVIVTMGSIAEPPEILGGLVGAALVGTFLGVLIAYGFVGPIGGYLGKYFDAEHKYYEAIKTGMLAHVQGNAPAVTVEFARKVIPEDVRPSFRELEEAMQKGSA
jgi:chemotaxis protein MotA